MRIKFLLNRPIAFINEIKALILSDLHIGLEHELFKSGIKIRPQAERFLKEIKDEIKNTGAKKVVILGDIKHDVPGISIRELRELPKFLDSLLNIVELHLIKGNHDSYIEEVLPKRAKFYSARGFSMNGFGFFHGNAWPSREVIKCKVLCMGHLHGAIEFTDRMGFRSIEPVWIVGKLVKDKIKQKYKEKTVGEKKIVIVPAFNPILSGRALNSKLEKEWLGPLLANKFLDEKKSKVYLLDGSCLGSLNEIKNL